MTDDPKKRHLKFWCLLVFVATVTISSTVMWWKLCVMAFDLQQVRVVEEVEHTRWKSYGVPYADGQPVIYRGWREKWIVRSKDGFFAEFDRDPGYKAGDRASLDWR
ncbi:MAG: hypothetical protein AAF989_08030 [Planctomycetota bacterium]